MKTNLLNNVICEGDFADFRADLAQQFRGEVRRRKWKRQSAWVAIAAAIALVAFLNFQKQPQTQVVTRPVIAPRDVVPTITTSMMKADEILVTAKEMVPMIRTQPLTAGAMVMTDHSKTWPSISDDELLDLFPKKPTGLMASRGEKRFIFLDPNDARRFMSSN
jgi:hypothetical protein